MDLPPTPVETIYRAEKIGKEEGLNFIYPGNIPGKSDTKCPSCGKVAVERNFTVKADVAENGVCKKCGKFLNIVTGWVNFSKLTQPAKTLFTEKRRNLINLSC